MSKQNFEGRCYGCPVQCDLDNRQAALREQVSELTAMAADVMMQPVGGGEPLLDRAVRALIEVGATEEEAHQFAGSTRAEVLSHIDDLEASADEIRASQLAITEGCKQGFIKARVAAKGVDWLVTLCSSKTLHDSTPEGETVHIPTHLEAK
jgi:hypothetical protein